VNENQIAKVVVDAAVNVHIKLGPGLLESVYEAVLARELMRRGLRNFGADLMKEGIKRIANGMEDTP
jgi:hypothetical protein